MLTSFTAVLPVNNSLVRHVGLLLLGPVTHMSLDVYMYAYITLSHLRSKKNPVYKCHIILASMRYKKYHTLKCAI